MGAQEAMQKLNNEIGKHLVGKEREIEMMFISLLFNGHTLLESVPGTGKTMLAKKFSEAVGGSFSRIQFTPDVLPGDITGIQFFNPKKQEFELLPGPIMANIVLADEINRATPRTQSSLLEAMEELQVTIDGHTIPLEKPFMVIATQNPVESQQGTFPLPVAQMDRFFIKLSASYPALEEEKRIMKISREESAGAPAETVLTGEEIASMSLKAKAVRIEEDVETYILGLTRLTREHPLIELGVSPRGTLALMRASQGKAYVSGRHFVTPDDVKAVAPYVLGHRIFLTTEGAMTKSHEAVILDILNSVPVPVEAGAN
ncbi:magnesium chelatase [Bacillus sp. FJAT-27225]|uniref:AAA family ATPase n=1 Tax=Bacillus sp. FJAT-27225 TaxID=1743144 RepID=UPI00080C223E|nr:MoxR family ATPase [Bacillus sp. FJAT-27225]OCA85623.1 magnesium chelatase [Bacillus sp. FJAT-27225]